MVKILLERGDVTPDIPDFGGRTPLTTAARVGSDGVVKLLLGCQKVNPNIADNRGITALPLWWATSSRNELAANLLQARRPANG